MNVRTIGTNRPSTIARLPYFSKNACVRSTCSRLNSRESSRFKIVGPALRPIQYPHRLPSSALATSTRTTSHSGAAMMPVWTNNPAVNSRESPGRKNPTSRPHSANTMRHSPSSTYGPSARIRYSGSSREAPEARWIVVCIVSNGLPTLSTVPAVRDRPAPRRVIGPSPEPTGDAAGRDRSPLQLWRSNTGSVPGSKIEMRARPVPSRAPTSSATIRTHRVTGSPPPHRAVRTGQDVGHRIERAAGRGLDRALADAGGLGDLGLGEATVVPQDEHLALAWGQAAQRVDHRLVLDRQHGQRLG